MKTIPVRFSAEVMGEFIVDDDDHEALAQYRWSMTSGYPTTTVDGKSVAVHRLLLGLVPGDGVVVDHLSHDTLDNRRENLSPGTHAENNRNRWDRTGRQWAQPFERETVPSGPRPESMAKEERLALVQRLYEAGTPIREIGIALGRKPNAGCVGPELAELRLAGRIEYRYKGCQKRSEGQQAA